MRFFRPISPGMFLLGAVLTGVLAGAGIGAAAYAGTTAIASSPAFAVTQPKAVPPALSPLAVVKKNAVRTPGLIAAPRQAVQPKRIVTVAKPAPAPVIPARAPQLPAAYAPYPDVPGQQVAPHTQTTAPVAVKAEDRKADAKKVDQTVAAAADKVDKTGASKAADKGTGGKDTGTGPNPPDKGKDMQQAAVKASPAGTTKAKSPTADHTAKH